MEGMAIFFIFAIRIKNGSLAEWLGGGLQNRIRRFESARNLLTLHISGCTPSGCSRIFYFGAESIIIFILFFTLFSFNKSA
jgi:hypothetical protein